MHRSPSFDLGYTHETAAAPAQAAIASADAARAARDLSARLRCLKTLLDAERDEHCGRSGGNTDKHPRELH